MDTSAIPRVNSRNFVALALVINRVRDGPTFVFHYPPNVQPSRGIDIDTQPAASNHGDILLERLSGSTAAEGASTGSRNCQTPSDSINHDMPWDNVAGFPTRDLASILTPGRPYHKKSFQLSLDPFCCVSYPIHVPENGKWKKKRKLQKSKPETSVHGDSENITKDTTQHDVDNGIDEILSRTLAKSSETMQSLQEDVQTGQGEASTKDTVYHRPQPNHASRVVPEDKHEKPSSMNMFNLVFILVPQKHEVNELVETLYLNIVKKVNKALNYAQGHSDFVWKESKRILAMKENGRDDRRRITSLWKDILSASSLASSIQEIYDSVSQNKIATLQLETQNGGTLTPSVQIPIPFSVSDLPLDNRFDPHHSGLWLTTANTFIEEDAFNEPSFLDRNFALLLMDDEKHILSELHAEPSAANMVEFVGLSKPTTS
jgi:hypothetical protein